jgi:hypothetical protein
MEEIKETLSLPTELGSAQTGRASWRGVGLAHQTGRSRMKLLGCLLSTRAQPGRLISEVSHESSDTVDWQFADAAGTRR